MVDLFSQDNSLDPLAPYKELEDYMGSDFYNYIGQTARELGVRAIANNPPNSIPELSTAFNSFRSINPKDIRVVMCSICPYPDGDNTGIPFECPYKIKPSLKGIYKGFYESSGLQPTYTPGKLDWLIEQGVFIINSKLTIQPNNSSSNSNVGWKEFITEVLACLLRKNKNIIIVFIGKSILSKSQIKKIKAKKDRVYSLIHPASTEKIGTLWKCDSVLKDINIKLVQEDNGIPIRWIPNITSIGMSIGKLNR